jgi:uncharacterized membrane protein
MTPKDRAAVSVAVATVSVALTTLSVAAGTSILKYLLFALSTASVIIAVVILTGLKPLSVACYLPLCKAKLSSAWSVCSRCKGFYCGFLLSAISATLVLRSELPSFLSWLGPWSSLIISLLLVLPTAIHGSRRRTHTDKSKPNGSRRNTWGLVITGFLAGLGWLFAYVSFQLMLSP